MKKIKNWKLWAIVVGIIYLVWPLDLIPGIVLDDLVVLFGTALPAIIEIMKKHGAQSPKTEE